MVVVRLEHSAPHNCPLHRTPPQYMPTSLQQPALPRPSRPSSPLHALRCLEQAAQTLVTQVAQTVHRDLKARQWRPK